MTAYARSYLAHTGAILFNFSMIGFFLSLSAFFGVILVVLFKPQGILAKKGA